MTDSMNSMVNGRDLAVGMHNLLEDIYTSIVAFANTQSQYGCSQ